MIFLLALLIGVVAGLRTMTAPAAVAWAARLGVLHLDGTWLGFLGAAWTPWVLSVLALGEYLGDLLPATPSRTTPPQFGARLVSGAACGAAMGFSGGGWLGGLVAGLIGAAIGTVGGAAARKRLAMAVSRVPAGLVEDGVAIVLGAVVVVAL